MATARATICNKKGLHARAAAKVVKTAASYAGVRLQLTRLPRPGETAQDPLPSAGATSILSLLMLAAEKGVEVEIVGEGDHSEQAVAALVDLITRRFDEEE